MKWKPVSSRYRYCISRFSRMATSTGSSARKVLSRVRPVRTFLSLVRTKALPLPGLTCWNSTTFMRFPSRLSVMPFLRSFVVAMASPYQELSTASASTASGTPPAQPDQLHPADHVGQGLAGIGHVAVDLVLDVGPGEGGVGQQVVDRLVAAPAEGVQAGVDDQPAGPPAVERQHAEALQVARVEAELVGQRELEVVAGDALVEGQGLVLVAGPGAGGRGVEPVDAGAAAVGRRGLVVAEHGVLGLVRAHLVDHARGPGDPADDLREGGHGPGQGVAARPEDLLRGGEAQGRVVAQPGTDLAHVGGAE